MSVTFQHTNGAVRVPERARRNIAGVRAWAGNNDLPEKTRVDFYRGDVWIDMVCEQIFTHGHLKTRMSTTLDTLVHERDLGFYFCNGVLLTNEAADLSGNPDGTFVVHESFESGRVTLTEGADGGFTELVGTADMVLEIVSDSSVEKDEVTLRRAYWDAGIPEYWLVDARGDEIAFHILKLGPKAYTETPHKSGWQKSAAFGKSFRIVRTLARGGQPRFTLEAK